VTIPARVALGILVAGVWSGSSHAADESAAREPAPEAFQIGPLLNRAKGNESVASYHEIVKRYRRQFGPRRMNGDVDNLSDQDRPSLHWVSGAGLEVQHLELQRVAWGAVCSRGVSCRAQIQMSPFALQLEMSPFGRITRPWRRAHGEGVLEDVRKRDRSGRYGS
jgi:hypothetical protein